ncbi:disease resistance protein RUN1-like [Cornus florida]|uniref:disease resistance protein RUN1-like n=1 Tax=Cornus florida TaxID=4283 RepID=UPI0028A0A66A|nr:disease resistance protein RUN1-like [Cornus florida]
MLGRNQASSSSAPVQKWRYDVFVSYRGEDTGKNFTDHLYSGLNGAGIYTFRDKNELKRGEKISSKLLEAIHGSKIFLVVFSQNYATSRWCLDELVEIMKRKKQYPLLVTVLPIFYKVIPSDVRKQTGSFGEAFAKHEKVDINKVSSWRAALADAGELSGWDLDATDGYEGELIKKIIEQILSVLNHTYLHIANHLVGIDARMDYIKSLLSVKTPDVLTVGIYGMGGIGKTTLAKAVFNHFFHSFESKSFLANVRENSMQNEKIIHLQEQFLSEILQIDARKVRNVDQGINVIEDRLCNRRVLVVLDDVDQLEQLNAFRCQSDSVRKKYFGPGSRIIITTRHLHLLERIEVSSKYMVKELNADESLKLFSLHAFKRTGPLECYVQLSKDVVGYCNGLPLALEVLGSYLREFKSIAEWENTLEKFRKNPHAKIQEKLKISFDALDDHEKQIFLDIACFFIGMEAYNVSRILDACGFYATSGIGVLTRRCLLTINEGKLMMHDLLRDMGRKIDCKRSVDNPGQRRRLWHWEDALEAVTNCKGTDQVEGLALNMDGPNKVVLRGEAFAGMHKLRLLQLKNVNITGGYEHLPKNLRWLCWHGFPLNSIPSNLYQEKLIAIDMQHSNLRQFWKEKKVFGKLKILDISHSHFLTRITTDFSTLPNLEKVTLEDCRCLKTIDESIGSLDKLRSLNLKDCANLRNLPRSICMLKSLERLRLSGCLKIDKLPEEIGEIESLVLLSASRTAIRRLPVSIVRVKNFRYLALSGSKGSPSMPMSLLNSLLGLTSLTRLRLHNVSTVLNDIGSLSSLKYLEFFHSGLYSLPASIKSLCKLEVLILRHCRNLRSLPDLPSSLTILFASNSSFERFPDLSNFSHPPLMFLWNCSKLVEFPWTENVLQKWYGRYGGTRVDDITFSCSEIPDWFSNQRSGNVLSIQVPQNMSMMKGFVLIVIYAARDFKFANSTAKYIVSVTNVTKDFCAPCVRYPIYGVLPIPHDYLTLSYVPLEKFEVNGGDEVEIEIDAGCELIVNKCGVIPVYIEAKKRTKMDTEDDETGLGHAGEKGKQKCHDAVAGPSHYWSYEEDTLSTYEMVVVPRFTEQRRFQCLRDFSVGDF